MQKYKGNTHYIIIAVHADDELVYGSEYFLHKPSSAILVTGGSSERTIKFDHICSNLGKCRSILPFTPDYLLSYDKTLIYGKLKDAVIVDIEANSEKEIFLIIPSVFDTHPEHTLIFSMSLRLAAELGLGCISCSYKDFEELEQNSGKKLEYMKVYYPTELTNLQVHHYGLTDKTTCTYLLHPRKKWYK